MQPQSALIVLACLALVTACTRTPPDQLPVEAETPIQFSMWRARLEPELPREEWRWFDVALQEFKFQLMLEQKVSGGEAIDTAVREKINGRTFADVLREGLQAHLKRKTAERDELEAAIAINAKRRIPAGDAAMLRELADFQENLRKKLPALNAELTAVQAELDRLKGKTP